MQSDTFVSDPVEPSLHDRPTRRPFGVTLLALGVLILAGIHLVRFYQAIKQWGLLVELLPFSPLYISLSGLVWGLAGLVLFWGLWQARAWAPRLTRLGALTFSLYYWLDRLLLANPAVALSNWPFAAAVTLILLAFIFWILSRRKVKVFFGENYE